jgi:Transmembrane secretion effector
VTPGSLEGHTRVSVWAPFRHRWFAAMWSAQFVSNIGSWMLTVGAQWLMLTLTSSATYVALVQTAASLPVVLFAVLAGRPEISSTGGISSWSRRDSCCWPPGPSAAWRCPAWPG